MKQPQFGASLSVKQCRAFGVSSQEVLKAALQDLGLRRFRLMSYWNEIEREPGRYDWRELDKQVKMITAAKGKVSLCLGVRQPRWPESHWPAWVLELSVSQRQERLFTFITAVIERYKKYPAIASYQLENEALLKTFGEQGDFDRRRLRQEFTLIKRLDPTRPVIMTTSTSWGIPLRRPIPDIVGFSYYNIVFNKGRYRRSLYQPWIFRLRAGLIRLIWQRRSFIHEMQAEPWGPLSIWEIPFEEQEKSMSLKQLQGHLATARRLKLFPVDLWGLEWWYYLKYKSNHPEFWETVKSTINL